MNCTHPQVNVIRLEPSKSDPSLALAKLHCPLCGSRWDGYLAQYTHPAPPLPAALKPIMLNGKEVRDFPRVIVTTDPWPEQ